MHSRFIKFRFDRRQTTGSCVGYFGINLSPAARATEGSSLLFDALAEPTDNARQDGLTIKQPFCTGSCQLNFLPDD